ncbi:hypothetical protein [Paracoccus aminophilus]|nr:hypothetical protein [Paracoccus aminophilus]
MTPKQKAAILAALTDHRESFDRIMTLVKAKIIDPREARALLNLDADA